jgi:hypothetical protein
MYIKRRTAIAIGIAPVTIGILPDKSVPLMEGPAVHRSRETFIRASLRTFFVNRVAVYVICGPSKVYYALWKASRW